MTFTADAAAVRTAYGRNYKEADALQKAARDTDQYYGPGRYRVRRRGRSRLNRYRRKRYYGHGLYGGSGGFWDDLRAGAVRAWNSGTGTAIRNFAGNALRNSTNPYAQAAGQMSGAMGIGDFTTTGTQTVVNNDIVDGGSGMTIPEFTPGGEMGTVQISHREYVADVFGPDSAGVFQNITYGLNPALPETFPWLSQVAANYEEYTIKQLIFSFRSTVTDFVASNGQVGSIILATQYNANDAPFASKQDMMEYAGAVSAKVSQQVQAGVECDPAQLSGPPGKYTRSGPTPPGEDVKTYDLGTLNVATSNTPTQFNNQAVGELWVSYTIELRKPKFFVTRAQQLLTDVFIGEVYPDGHSGTGLRLSDVPWSVGQQNRIGGLLTREYPGFPLAQNYLYYVFPATFSGDIEIIVSGQPDPSAIGAGFIGIGAGGSPQGMIPIKDIWAGDPAAWTSGTLSNFTGGTTGSTNIQHWKIVSPTTAASTTDNVFVIQGFATTDIYNLWQRFNITVRMYNTGLNYAKSHRPIMTNPSTGLVVDFPQGTGTLP